MRRTSSLLALIVLGCSSLTGPEGDVTTQVSLTPRVGTRGESVTVQMVGHNSGPDSILARGGCAPGLGFEVTMPDGQRRDPMGEVPWICPLFDSQILAPSETDTVTHVWTAPS